MRSRWVFGGIVAVIAGWLYVSNASWIAPAPKGTPRLLAERGVRQRFKPAPKAFDLNYCAARHMLPPTSPYIENTLPSMRAAFAAGADVITVPVESTPDGEFAVYKEGLLNCRTNGDGDSMVLRMPELKKLDVGYGYTADGGKTFPFRGKGVGLMPTLGEVFAAFPGKQLVLQLRRNDPAEADGLNEYLFDHGGPHDERLWAVYGPTEHLKQLRRSGRVVSKLEMLWCARSYRQFGWTGHVPDACRDGFILVPVNELGSFWGWPDRFLERMRKANTEVILTGAVAKDGAFFGTAIPADLDELPGLTTADLDVVPAGYSGLIATDAIETIGPEVRRRWPVRNAGG